MSIDQTAKKHYDYAILGGGAAGLSLAMALSNKAIGDYQFIVIEERSEYTNDRTWGFWEFPDLPDYLGGIIKKRWLRWQISTEESSCIMHSHKHPYCVIAASDFYQHAQSIIEKNPNIDILTGEPVIKIIDDDVTSQVITKNRTLGVSHILDTRPRKPKTFPNHGMYQCFFGLEITTEPNCKTQFNDSLAQLMRELTPTPEGLAFQYTLPYSPQSALIEYTVFSPQRISPESLRNACIDSIESTYPGIKYSIAREESGVLPMAVQTPLDKEKRRTYGGTAGGSLRAATGYAFANIQRWAVRSANQIKVHKKPKSDEPSLWLRFLDALFLAVIKVSAARARDYFLRMAIALNGNHFARFMSQKARLEDYLLIIRSLPPLPFLKRLALNILGRP